MAKNKFYKGTIDEFKTWFSGLDKESALYKDLQNSVVYISENFDKEPEDLSEFVGAIYANGAIIAGGGDIKWDDPEFSAAALEYEK